MYLFYSFWQRKLHTKLLFWSAKQRYACFQCRDLTAQGSGANHQEVSRIWAQMSLWRNFPFDLYIHAFLTNSFKYLVTTRQWLWSGGWKLYVNVYVKKKLNNKIVEFIAWTVVITLGVQYQRIVLFYTIQRHCVFFLSPLIFIFSLWFKLGAWWALLFWRTFIKGQMRKKLSPVILKSTSNFPLKKTLVTLTL